jgi:undecaprenyl-diphosphatase
VSRRRRGGSTASEVVSKPRLRTRLGATFNPQTATGLALTVALVLAIGGGLLLCVLAFVVRADPNLLGVDASVAAWGDRHATTFSTHGLSAVTQLGTTITILVAGTAVVLVDYFRTHSLWAVPFLLLVVAGEKLLTTTIKNLADRVRPSLNPVAGTLGPSFPSGHSASAAAFFAAAALLLGRHQGPRGMASSPSAVGIAVAVARSRDARRSLAHRHVTPASRSAGAGSRSAHRLRRAPRLGASAGSPPTPPIQHHGPPATAPLVGRSKHRPGALAAGRGIRRCPPVAPRAI